MIEDKFEKIEGRIRQSVNMDDENKDALLQLLTELKTEIKSTSVEVGTGLKKDISKIDDEDEGIIKSAFSDINEKIAELEESHPRLVQILNSISTQLSNSGF